MYAAVVMFLSPLIMMIWHKNIWCLIDIGLFMVSVHRGFQNGLPVLR
jgi:hypothetical protein